MFTAVGPTHGLTDVDGSFANSPHMAAILHNCCMYRSFATLDRHKESIGNNTGKQAEILVFINGRHLRLCRWHRRPHIRKHVRIYSRNTTWHSTSILIIKQKNITVLHMAYYVSDTFIFGVICQGTVLTDSSMTPMCSYAETVNKLVAHEVDAWPSYK